ncbi:hypothetical protein [Actinomadura rugatobispora]|uniref:Uncharacterized protein n=1 Tax=Actinomadura rugatobispora TaxID=1994 RepID=A0ABW1AAB4_9ACTN
MTLAPARPRGPRDPAAPHPLAAARRAFDPRAAASSATPLDQGNSTSSTADHPGDRGHPITAGGPSRPRSRSAAGELIDEPRGAA